MSTKPSHIAREPTMLSNLRAQSSRHLEKLVESAKSSTKELLHQNDHVQLTKNPNNYTYEDLVAIEKDRRSLLLRVKRFSVINILSSFHGTVLPEIIQSPFSWFILFMYVGLRYLLRAMPEGKNLPPMDLSYVSLIGGFMSFSLVFFVSQAYSRLCAQYDRSAAITGRVFNLMFLARNNLPAVEAWRLLRYLNAAHVTGYAGLSNVYTEENLFEEMVEKYQLLTYQELQRIREIGVGGPACREIFGWCLDLLYSAYKEDQQQRRSASKSCENASEPSLDIITLQTMISEVLVMRSCIGKLYNFEDQPIPFVYVHVLFFLSLFYLPMATYAIAVDFPVGSFFPLPDLLGAFVVFLNIVYVVGLREIGRAMVLPYGDDTHDLSVLHYLNSTMLGSRRILSGYNAPPRSAATEEEMEQARPSKGPGFGNISSALSTFVKKFTTPGTSQKLATTTHNNYSSDGPKHRNCHVARNSDQRAGDSNSQEDSNMDPMTDVYRLNAQINDRGYVPMPTHSNQFYSFNPETNSYEPTSQLQQQLNNTQMVYAVAPPQQTRPSSASPLVPTSATAISQPQQPLGGLRSSRR